MKTDYEVRKRIELIYNDEFLHGCCKAMSIGTLLWVLDMSNPTSKNRRRTNAQT